MADTTPLITEKQVLEHLRDIVFKPYQRSIFAAIGHHLQWSEDDVGSYSLAGFVTLCRNVSSGTENVMNPDGTKPHPIISTALLSYAHFLEHFFYELGSPPCIPDWLDLTCGDFERSVLLPPAGTTKSANFRVGFKISPSRIERDSSQFPSITLDRYATSFMESFMAMARAQNVDHVLDKNYRPTDAEETIVFREQQIYVFGVLRRNVRTDVPSSIIHRCTQADRPDTQAVWTKLVEY